MQKKVRRGFTLPEILVTVTVVAVLAAVVVPAVTQYVGKGDAPSTQQDLTQLRNSITAYVADNRTMPTSLGDLVKAPASVSNTWKGPYTSAVLNADSSYTSPGLKAIFNKSLTQSGGYLTLTVTTTNNTCKELWALDAAVDNSSASALNAATVAAAGNLTWTGGSSDGTCAQTYASGSTSNQTTEAGTAFGGTATLRILTIGQ